MSETENFKLDFIQNFLLSFPSAQTKINALSVFWVQMRPSLDVQYILTGL